MKLNNILSFFAPKDAKFIPMLIETSEILSKSAGYLEELFSTEDRSDITRLCALIKKEETAGDKATGKIIKALNDTFITPFDREDIDTLADALDDAIDAINRSGQKVLLYAPEKLPPVTLQLASIAKNGTREVEEAVKMLSNINKNYSAIRQHSKEIKKLEEKADSVYETGIIELFRSEVSAIEVIKVKTIIQELERSVNRINRVGKVLKSILVKYA
jgi:Phosphate transport regulator (distant homolog of PhoU)